MHERTINIGGKENPGLVYTVKVPDRDELPQSAQDFLYNYGEGQKLQDCHVSAKTPDEKRAMIDKTIAALKSGEIRIGAARVGDPVAAEVKRQATALARQAAKKAGTKLTPEYLKTDAFAALVKQYSENEKVIAFAKKTVAEQRELADLS